MLNEKFLNRIEKLTHSNGCPQIQMTHNYAISLKAGLYMHAISGSEYLCRYKYTYINIQKYNSIS